MSGMPIDGVRLNSISITNYKGIDSFRFEFPSPTFDDEPDVTMLCGKNGVGKSSVLESCALILTAPNFMSIESELSWNSFPVNTHPLLSRLPNLLIRSGSKKTEIVGEMEKDNKFFTINLSIDFDGIHLSCNPNYFSEFSNNFIDNDGKNVIDIIARILGFNNVPVINSWFMLFNSFRSIGFDTPNLNDLAKIESNTGSSENIYADSFKLSLLELLINNSNIFGHEDEHNNSHLNNNGLLSEDENSKALNYFKLVIKQYTEGMFLHPKVLRDKSYDFMIEIEKGKPFSFDGLGYGHKEIISMLFLIWNYSKSSPRVILIDEPELHFNPEWQKKFVLDTFSISNQNQFIYATHSEDVVNAVDIDRCIILKK